MGTAVILFNSAESFEQIINTSSRPNVKSNENWSRRSRENYLKIKQLYTCSPRVRAVTPGEQNFSCNYKALLLWLYM